MKPGFHRPARARTGFTLIELLLALTIMAMLVTALFTFVFSMGEIWGRGGEKRLFLQHVNAVTRHVESLLQRAAWPRGGVGLDEPFNVEEIRLGNGGSSRLLGFVVWEGDRLLRWPEEAIPEVQCHLNVERDQGLVLYWRSALESSERNDPPRQLVLSPLVTKMSYLYHDPENDTWRRDESPRRGSDGAWLIPDRLILSFQQSGFEEQRELNLPAGGGLTN